MALSISNTYASVFEVEVNEKYVKANVTTGRKTKDVDENGRPVYLNSYWSNTHFVGKCLDNAKKLTNKTRIKITSGILTHEKSNKTDEFGKPIYYYDLVIFEFEPVEQPGNNSENSHPSNDVKNGGSEDLPF